MSADSNISEVIEILVDTLRRLTERSDYLRELDAAVGDGDLGITVSRGAHAVQEAWRAAAPDDLKLLLVSSAAAFSRANPSTMAALVGAGLLAAAKNVAPGEQFASAATPSLLHSFYDKIAERGKAQPGDKTILDAIAPSIVAAEGAASGALLSDMTAAAVEGLERTTNLAGRRGRAGWVGDRGIGHPDPGAAFFVEFLRAITASVEEATPTRSEVR